MEQDKDLTQRFLNLTRKLLADDEEPREEEHEADHRSDDESKPSSDDLVQRFKNLTRKDMTEAEDDDRPKDHAVLGDMLKRVLVRDFENDKKEEEALALRRENMSGVGDDMDLDRRQNMAGVGDNLSRRECMAGVGDDLDFELPQMVVDLRDGPFPIGNFAKIWLAQRPRRISPAAESPPMVQVPSAGSAARAADSGDSHALRELRRQAEERVSKSWQGPAERESIKKFKENLGLSDELELGLKLLCPLALTRVLTCQAVDGPTVRYLISKLDPSAFDLLHRLECGGISVSAPPGNLQRQDVDLRALDLIRKLKGDCAENKASSRPGHERKADPDGDQRERFARLCQRESSRRRSHVRRDRSRSRARRRRGH